MSHLTSGEKDNCLDSLYQTLFGEEVVNRWRELKTRLDFDLESDFVSWILDYIDETYFNEVADESFARQLSQHTSQSHMMHHPQSQQHHHPKSQAFRSDIMGGAEGMNRGRRMSAMGQHQQSVAPTYRGNASNINVTAGMPIKQEPGDMSEENYPEIKQEFQESDMENEDSEEEEEEDDDDEGWPDLRPPLHHVGNINNIRRPLPHTVNPPLQPRSNVNQMSMRSSIRSNLQRPLPSNMSRHAVPPFQPRPTITPRPRQRMPRLPVPPVRSLTHTFRPFRTAPPSAALNRQPMPDRNKPVGLVAPGPGRPPYPIRSPSRSSHTSPAAGVMRNRSDVMASSATSAISNVAVKEEQYSPSQMEHDEEDDDMDDYDDEGEGLEEGGESNEDEEEEEEFYHGMDDEEDGNLSQPVGDGGSSRPHRCSHCAAAFRSEEALSRHVAALHERGKKMAAGRTYDCQFCGKHCTSLKEKKDHLNNDHPDQQYECKYCHKLFAHLRSLSTHEKKVCLKHHYQQQQHHGNVASSGMSFSQHQHTTVPTHSQQQQPMQVPTHSPHINQQQQQQHGQQQPMQVPTHSPHINQQQPMHLPAHSHINQQQPMHLPAHSPHINQQQHMQVPTLTPPQHQQDNEEQKPPSQQRQHSQQQQHQSPTVGVEQAEDQNQPKLKQEYD